MRAPRWPAIGNADISVWPDFVDHLPDQAARISINVVAPSAAPALPAVTPRPTSPWPSASARLVTRLLGVDLGTKRIGLAVGDTRNGLGRAADDDQPRRRSSATRARSATWRASSASTSWSWVCR